MNVRTRLLSLGVALAVLPLAATAGLNAFIIARSASGAASAAVAPAVATLVVALVFAVAAPVVLARSANRISKPVKRLSDLAKSVGEGRFEIVGEVLDRMRPRGRPSTGDEIDGLTAEFRDMAERLAELTKSLESLVAERTDDLEKSNSHLRRTNEELSSAIDELKATQDYLVSAEKLASLGQLVAGIAHELNTPIGAVISAAGDLGDSITRRLLDTMELYRNLGEAEFAAFRLLSERALAERPGLDTREERRVRRELSTALEAAGVPDAYDAADKLTELGVRDPADPLVASVEGARGIALLEAAWNLASMERSLRIIALASDKAAKVIKSLKLYTRQEEGESAREVDVVAEIETILVLYQSATKHGTEISRRYERVPSVVCPRDKMNQVWMNLVDNALRSMQYKGELTIFVRDDGDFVAVSVADTGPGIPDEIRPRIFSPFFTTRPSGEGTGLGLNISKRIVEESGGTIGFESGPGGATFTVRLPKSRVRKEES